MSRGIFIRKERSDEEPEIFTGLAGPVLLEAKEAVTCFTTNGNYTIYTFCFEVTVCFGF